MKKQTTKKYMFRKSPPFKANEFCGKTKKGNDGKMYISVSNKNGVCRWVSKAGRKSLSTRSKMMRKNKSELIKLVSEKLSKKTKKELVSIILSSGYIPVTDNVGADDGKILADNKNSEVNCEKLLWGENKSRYENRKIEDDNMRKKSGIMRDLTREEFDSNRLNFINCKKSRRIDCYGKQRQNKKCFVTTGYLKDDIKYMYVASPNDLFKDIDIYISEVNWTTAENQGSVSNHSNILGYDRTKDIFGPPVCAGFIKFKNGKIIEIDNDSGHYKPSFDSLKCFVKILYTKYKNCFHKNAIIIEGIITIEHKQKEKRHISIKDL